LVRYQIRVAADHTIPNDLIGYITGINFNVKALKAMMTIYGEVNHGLVLEKLCYGKNIHYKFVCYRLAW